MSQEFRSKPKKTKEEIIDQSPSVVQRVLQKQEIEDAFRDRTNRNKTAQDRRIHGFYEKEK